MERPDKYYIPDNYNDGHEMRGIPYRNLIEGGIVSWLAKELISLTPFVLNIKLIADVIVIGIIMVIFAIGVKGESLTQFIYSYYLFRKSKRKWHMRPVGYVLHKDRLKAVKNSGKDKKEDIKEIKKEEKQYEQKNRSGHKKEVERRKAIKERSSQKS